MPASSRPTEGFSDIINFIFISVLFYDISACTVRCNYSDEENIAYLIVKEPNKFNIPAII
jgi:hypothetical protein